MNARGIPEIVGPQQSLVKGLLDSSTDAAQIWSLPPILSHGIESHGDAYMEPLKIIKGKRDSKFEAMQGPQRPPQEDTIIARMEQERDWMAGRANPNDADNGQHAAVSREEKVVWFLAHVRETMRMMLALARENASDELLARITDAAGDALIRSRADIAGDFDLRLVFDPADLDFENLTKRLEATKNTILSIDRSGAIDTVPLAQSAFRSIFPYMADDVIRDVGQAESDELLDEARNLSLLRAGVMPQLDTDGNWNYELRRKWYDDMAAANPQVFADMGPDKQALVQQWLQGLEQQAVQFGANVETGRTGIKPPEAQPAPEGVPA